MEYSRRNFMKAAGVGAVAVTTTVSAVVAAATGRGSRRSRRHWRFPRR